MLDLNAFAKQAHALSREKGWYQDRDLLHPDTQLSMEALIHSELAEATECIRDGELELYFDRGEPPGRETVPVHYLTGRLMKPCGLPSEIADVVIRSLDYKEAFNYHDFTELVFSGSPDNSPVALVAEIGRIHSVVGDWHPRWIQRVVEKCYGFAQQAGFDLDAAILTKHAFNATRPHRHGGKAL